MLAEVRGILQAAVLPDGRRVVAVDLVLPSREAALAVRDEAWSAGVQRTLFSDGAGGLLEPRAASEG